MKQNKMIPLAVIVAFGMSVLTGCGSKTENPGEPPAEVIRGESTDAGMDSVQAGNGTDIAESDSGNAYEGEILSDAISVRIGRESRTEWNIDLYNNDAALTMLDYLSGSALLFPTYTYDGEGGFVAQGIRGNYTDDDEQSIADVKCGELYLFSGGQLRFYFKDREGANITATPIGYYTDTEGLADAVQEAYTSNLDDTWGVSVYFWITKTLK